MNSQIRSFTVGLIGIVLVGILTDGVFGHSYVTSPTSRSNQKQTLTGCRGPNCLGPCDAPASRARTPITVSRGSTININWPRNNHAGGFIRIAWAPTTQSDSHSVFDANVQEIVCHERGGCKPDSANDPNGGDSAPADGSFQPCRLSVVVPPHLTDGKWTMQWAWFGGAFSLGDYYSCVDYQISGGASGAKPDAFFLGGDYTYPNEQKCKFFNTDRLHQCVNEPCNNPIYPSSRERSGPAYGVSSSSGSSGSSTTTTTTTTTGPKPATTGKLPATTGRAASTTTTTTTSSRSSSTGTPSPPPPVPSGSNCAGATSLSQSTASVVNVNTWGNTLQAMIELRVKETKLSNWYLQVIWPSSAVTTRVQNIYNAGALQCEGTSPVRHVMIKPVGNWAKNLASGTVLNIEVFASNNGLSPAFIQANTQVRVFSA